MDKITQQVFKNIELLWEEEVNFIKNLIRYPSTLSNETDIQIFIKNELLRMGLEVDIFDIDISKICKMPGYASTDWSYEDRPQVVGVHRSDTATGRSLVLNGHVDVVPSGSLRYWIHNPWDGIIEGDRLYGRGAADMKAGLAANVYALKAIQKAGIKLDGDVIIQSVTEEECGGNGTLACLEKGYIGDGCLIPEPLSGLVIGTGGILWLRVVVTGKPGHPSTGYKTINAIENAMKIMQSLKSLEVEWNLELNNEYMGLEHPVNFVLSIINGGEWPSSPPDDCTFVVRIGFTPDIKIEEVKDIVERHILDYAKKDKAFAGNLPVTKWMSINAEGVVNDRKDVFIETLSAAHQSVTGGEPKYTYSAGSADSRFWPLYYKLPAVCYGPLGANYHGHNEYVYLSSVLDTTKVIAQFILDWCSVSESNFLLNV